MWRDHRHRQPLPVNDNFLRLWYRHLTCWLCSGMYGNMLRKNSGSKVWSLYLSLIIFSCSVISFPADLACELPSSLALQDKFLHSREIVCRGEGSARDRTMKMSGSWQTFTCLVSRAENARPADYKWLWAFVHQKNCGRTACTREYKPWQFEDCGYHKHDILFVKRMKGLSF